MVARAFHQSPDQVRGWQEEDYLCALSDLEKAPEMSRMIYALYKMIGKGFFGMK